VTLTDKIVDSPEGLFPGGWCNDGSVPVGASIVQSFYSMDSFITHFIDRLNSELRRLDEKSFLIRKNKMKKVGK
jgi:hypothetical protein